eukprot:Em0002g915a
MDSNLSIVPEEKDAFKKRLEDNTASQSAMLGSGDFDDPMIGANEYERDNHHSHSWKQPENVAKEMKYWWVSSPYKHSIIHG